jgi:hypothetical protein
MISTGAAIKIREFFLQAKKKELYWLTKFQPMPNTKE